ncbi:PspC domain-containing protein [Clostridium grantii]|uniref:Phage shock protein C (PspC) family protein n=1 Tax=Clostridium grantii DSM 8605 TaxID=1121316 RepID=A0A1M5WSM7_9CLOT|nr:phage shock protein C (PspC) family protein [Clostridium grantii DSM 8605]
MSNFKLYKSTTDKKISGVCGGLAENLGVDPSIVRIVWAVISIFYGIGIILYIIAALILPEKRPEDYEGRIQKPNNDFSNKEKSPETKVTDVNFKEVKSYDDVQQ